MLRLFVSIAILIGSMAMPFISKAEIDDFEGYQGFVDVGYTFGTGEYGLNCINLTTSHGIQIIPTYLFAGIGVGVQYFYGAKEVAIPLFADVRSCFLPEENVSPFVDVKVGYSAIPGKGSDISDGGFYLKPTLGCAFVLKDFVALNAGIGYVFESVNITAIGRRRNIGGFAITIGVQF